MQVPEHQGAKFEKQVWQADGPCFETWTLLIREGSAESQPS